MEHCKCTCVNCVNNSNPILGGPGSRLDLHWEYNSIAPAKSQKYNISKELEKSRKQVKESCKGFEQWV